MGREREGRTREGVGEKECLSSMDEKTEAQRGPRAALRDKGQELSQQEQVKGPGSLQQP